MAITVLSADEYKAQEFDAVLVRENAVVCVDADEDRVRMIPLEKVSHVEADTDAMISGRDLPDTFHGGGRCAFVDVERFPDLQAHLEQLDRETI